MQNTWSQDVFIKAYKYAANAHLGQKMPGTDLPYIAHLTLVAMEVIAALQAEPVDDPALAIQCALLHDIIEDQGYTYSRIREDFGEKLAEGVLALTKDSSLPETAQLRDSLFRIKLQPREVWMVKLADRIANLQEPPRFWNREKILKYGEDAREILEMLRPASPFLALRLHKKILAYQRYSSWK